MTKKIIIEINDDAYDKILELAEYKTLQNKYIKKENKTVSIEDFVRGFIYKGIKDIEEYQDLIDLSGLETTSKPFKYRNNFKELFNKIHPDMKQTEISEKTGINRTNLNQILNNIVQPRLDFFLRLWILLDCPPITECIYKEDD